MWWRWWCRGRGERERERVREGGGRTTNERGSRRTDVFSSFFLLSLTFPTRGTVLKTRSFTNPVASYAARCAWDSGTSLSGNDGRYVGRRCQTIREEIKQRNNRRRGFDRERTAATSSSKDGALLLLLQRLERRGAAARKMLTVRDRSSEAKRHREARARA